MNNNSKKLKVTKKTETTATTTTPKGNPKLFKLTIKNAQKQGGKLYALADPESLYADNRFQRANSTTEGQINKMAREFDINLFDPIITSPHYDENMFSILDGYHRYRTAMKIGMDAIPIVIIENLSREPEKRLIQEADIFRKQGDNVHRVTIVQRHKSNLLNNVKENVIVQNLADKYDLEIKDGRAQGRFKTNVLAGFGTALIIARFDPDMLDDIFMLICSSLWNKETNGLSNDVIKILSDILYIHRNDREETMKLLGKYMKENSPEQLRAEGQAKYALRKGRVQQQDLVLEDYITNNSNILRCYTGGKIFKDKKEMEKAKDAENAA